MCLVKLLSSRGVSDDSLRAHASGWLWNYRSWRRHFGNAPACCSTERASTASDREPPPIYIDHACRKPRDYVKRSGNASYFLGDGDGAGRRRV